MSKTKHTDSPEAVSDMLKALEAAHKGFVDILDNHPDVWSKNILKMSPERIEWRKIIKAYSANVNQAISKSKVLVDNP